LQARRISLVYHSLPFTQVFYHCVLFFLATYWSLEKMDQDDCASLSYGVM
jgi:hypothetical protein